MPKDLIGFYLGENTNSAGFTIEEIWNWDDTHLERVHNYIQWLFPLEEKSRAIPSSPTLKPHTIKEFCENEDLREKLLRSFRIMLEFYGLQYSDDSGVVVIQKTPSFNQKANNWLNEYNHNHLRITRIIKSLNVLGLGEHAKAFQRAMLSIAEQTPEDVAEVTVRFWETAI
jgi:hypothetical protein